MTDEERDQIIADEKEALRKAAICRACPHSTKRSRSDWDQCNICGCPIDRIVRKKTKVCEVGRW